MNCISFSNSRYRVIPFFIIDLVVIFFLLLQCVFHLKRTCLVQRDIVYYCFALLL